jgi:uncharacterized protein (TIGR02246 family)
VRQQIEAVYTTFDDAQHKHDAAATASLYTQDAVQVRSWESDGGLASGQQAIEKRFAVEFASSPGEFVGKLVQVNPVRRRDIDYLGMELGHMEGLLCQDFCS